MVRRSDVLAAVTAATELAVKPSPSQIVATMRLIMDGNVDGIWWMMRLAEKRLKLEILEKIAALPDA